MSPILVRPVREQLEHDRVIRQLQAKYKRKFDVAINPGNEQTAPVAVGPWPRYPDLVLQSTDRRHKLLGTVEVETAESVNNLEAMSQWATFARFRAPFHLYVPVSSVDTAKRLCAALPISVAEILGVQRARRPDSVHPRSPIGGRQGPRFRRDESHGAPEAPRRLQPGEIGSYGGEEQGSEQSREQSGEEGREEHTEEHREEARGAWPRHEGRQGYEGRQVYESCQGYKGRQSYEESLEVVEAEEA